MRSACSCITTVSHLSGITAPVIIRTHSPGPTGPVYALPAQAVPITLRSAAKRSDAATAYPSIAELVWLGTSTGEITSSAKILLRAPRTGTHSISLIGVIASTIRARATSTSSNAGSYSSSQLGCTITSVCLFTVAFPVS